MPQGRFDPTPIEQYLDQLNLKRAVPLVIGGVVVLLVLIGVFTSFHTVEPEGRAVVKRFGEVVAIRDPGLHFKFPYGIDRVHFVRTERQLTHEFGFRTVDATGDRTQYRKQPDESLMLTGDLKVIDVEWVVQYRVNDPDRWLHRVNRADKTIRDISEAVMRRIVGNELGSDVLTEKRVQVAMQARDEIEEILHSFDMGIVVRRVELQDVTPPDRVKPAFNEVNQAEQQRERYINEAERRRNQVIPRAEGEAQQIVEEAEAYSAERVNRALGEADRFTAILTEYRNVPEVTRRRLYLEMIDNVLPNIGRIYVVEEGQSAPLPLLNLGDGERPIGGRGDRD